MSNENKSGGVPPIVGIIAGVVLVALGGFGATNGEFGLHGLVETLEGQGIPLTPSKTLSTIGVFLILFPVIKFFFLNPLVQAITERNANLEQTFSEAEALRNEMTKTRNEFESRLAASEAAAREHIEAQIKEAQALRQTLMNEAAARADAMITHAQQEIEAERDRILTSLRTQAVELSLAAAEKIIGANMDTDANRRLVNEFVTGLEVKS